MPNRQTDLFTDGLADRLANDFIETMTELGLDREAQEQAVLRLMFRHVWKQLQRFPKRHRELFLVLLTEAVLKGEP
ncbi:hypothetical protein IQ254_10670 [Nodosilinea sp. LEGE 07088]|uniref:hypothetical protein n=1 Tax=Nodosilinea sp. LEGE 07088 TaxID=2777968 RepID=UPI00187EE8AC|nr:hypothetical protein [Nodosilinea sp. LEGE 07088]MBE9137672.1 hypothetical protein [Nodosilinea sp. LEGE 07088]